MDTVMNAPRRNITTTYNAPDMGEFAEILCDGHV